MEVRDLFFNCKSFKSPIYCKLNYPKPVNRDERPLAEDGNPSGLKILVLGKLRFTMKILHNFLHFVLKLQLDHF